MVTKVIPISRKLISSEVKNVPHESELLTDAAWQFAYALLWQHQQLSSFEVGRSRFHISNYIKRAPDRIKAFLHFCERVALAERYTSAGILTNPPMPSIWLNPKYEHGISETLSLLSELNRKREDVPGYMDQIFIIAEGYSQYILRPSAKVFRRCRRKLLNLSAYGMLQHYYNATLQSHYLIRP